MTSLARTIVYSGIVAIGVFLGCIVLRFPISGDDVDPPACASLLLLRTTCSEGRALIESVTSAGVAVVVLVVGRLLFARFKLDT